jgi:hypothetical protein
MMKKYIAISIVEIGLLAFWIACAYYAIWIR